MLIRDFVKTDIALILTNTLIKISIFQMMRITRERLLIILCGLSMSALLQGQSLKINEAISSNTTYLDEDGDGSDWLELYNGSDRTIDLENWSITDDQTEPQQWIMPSYSLLRDSYLVIRASGKDRRDINFSQSIIKQGDSFRYAIPKTSIDEDWHQPDFDDTNWKIGMSGFGYGDGDDTTVLPSGTSSIYIRRSFEVDQLSTISNLVLDIDYDDSFVAYINGVEVTRANISGQPPSYNATANTDHEAVLYSSGTLERFVIANPQLVLVEGENILAIQTHNVSRTSSDLTVIPFLSAEMSVPNPVWSAVPKVVDLPNRMWHTNFKLSGGKETLYLYNPAGILVDSLLLVDSPVNVSIGCSESSEAIQFFDKPTPGLKNVTSGFDGVWSGEIKFSHEGGVVHPFPLELSVDEEGGEIRYTLTSQIPNESSTLYQGPISISSNQVVRARFFKEGYLSTRTFSRTYITNAQHDLPIISLITEPENFYDTQSGIYVRGTSSESDFPFFGSNFWEDWEKPVHFTFYEGDGTVGEMTDAGIKIFGGWSRGFDQRSFSLFARKQYGDGSFKHSFFPELEYTSFESLVLRNSGNDWNRTMLRDATLTSLMAGSGLEFQAYRPTVVYLNGSYFGLYNLREKINEHFIASKQELNPDSIDILELNAKILKGTNEEYEDLIDYVATNNLATTSAFNYVRDRVDLDNFALYYAAQIYFDNTDWPGNNIKYWKVQGGKWRWVLFDTDFGFGIWDANNFTNNTLQFALRDNGPGWPNPPWSTLLFRQLNTNQTFQHVFINQMADAMNTRFLPEVVHAKIEEHESVITNEIQRQFQRWRGSFSNWSQHIQNMKNFASKRARYVKDYIKSEFDLPSVNELRLSYDSSNLSGYLVVNNRIRIETTKWSGDYFGTVPIDIKAIPRAGYVFSHWEGDISSTEQTISVDVDRPMSIKAVFEQESFVLLPVVINEINYKSSQDFDTGDWIELHNTADVSIDLSNWKVTDTDANDFTIPQGVTIDPESYLILARSTEQFNTLLPAVPAIGDLGFGLSSNGEVLTLYNHAGEFQDQVSYMNSEPWPEDANGVGYTLELISPDLDNTKAENWAAVNQTGSPGRANTMSTSVIDISNLGSLSVYPIPTSTELNIELTLQSASRIELNIINASGQQIDQIVKSSLQEGTHQYTLDVERYSSGIYIVKLNVIGGSHNLYFVKSD